MKTIKRKARFADKDLSSWTGLGKSGHVQIPTFGPIPLASGPKLTFEVISWWFCMVLRGGDAKTLFFWAPPGKTMQNHLEITLKSQFGIQSVRNWIKQSELGHAKLFLKSELGHVHEHQKLRVRAPSSRKQELLFLKNYTFLIFIRTFIFLNAYL